MSEVVPAQLPAPVCSRPPGLALAAKFLRLNHLGEFIAINIYGAQIAVCRLTAPGLRSTLVEFRIHERRHLDLFAKEMAVRGICRSVLYGFLGMGGYLLGVLTAAFGRSGILACTAAVETVVLRHLQHQLRALATLDDQRAMATIEAILEDEESHRELGTPPERGWIHRAVFAAVAPPTAWIINLGMCC